MSAEDHDIRPQWLTVALALIAAFAYEVGRSDGGGRLSVFTLIAALSAGVALLHVLAVRLERRVPWTARFGAPLALSVGIGTIVVAYVQRTVFGTGLPLELILVASLRNAVLATAVLSYDPEFRRPTAILGTFTIVFATALTTDPLFYGLVVLFAMLGVWWLMGAYWGGLRVNLLPTAEEHRPTRWILLLPLVVGGCLLAMPLVARDTTRALMGIAPSSGGTGGYDPFARDGVGNGDMLVAGEKDIQSFAPIDDAPFLNSHEPSLYDCFDENYDEPVLPKKRTQRAIALPPEVLADLRERHLAKSEKANRQFSTMRKQPGSKRGSNVESIRDDALLFVAGRVPVHLRLALYDVFDGRAWHEESMLPNPRPMRLDTIDGKPWLRVDGNLDRDDFPQSVTHAVKFVNLRSARLPSPPNTIGLHIDKVDRSDMFLWAQPSIVKLPRKRVPPLLVVHTHAGIVDPSRLEGRLLAGPHRHRHHGLLPTDATTKRIAALAASWTSDVEGGWNRVERIVERLRADYVLDPEARPPADAESPVGHFLFESRRGPDYQFATAAVLMIRSLGYSARFVSGFYADPDDYDPRSRHTPIRSDDVHVWAEVDIGTSTWITIDPSPGYEVLGLEPSIWERAVDLAFHVAGWTSRHRVLLTLVLVLLAGAIRFRADLADGVRTLAWKLQPPRDERVAALRAWAIVERRLVALGYGRPSGTTPRRWVVNGLPWLDASVRQRLAELVRLAEWAAFAPGTSPAGPGDPEICDRVVREDTLRALRVMVRRSVAAETPSTDRHLSELAT